VRLDPRLTHLTGIVMADSGSPFRQSVLINAGARDGVMDGWAAMDGLGLVGRISGVGEKTSRVILLTDTNSRIPVVVQPSGQTAILTGDNSPLPPLDFVDDPDTLRAGDLVFSTADGGIFPAGLVVGKVVVQSDKRLRVRLEADFNRLEYLRILRSRPMEVIPDEGSLIVPKLPMQGPPSR
jgi:rod shape-determining protein MreC